MQKTIKSYHMDIGGLYSPSLEGFTKVNKTFKITYNWKICDKFNTYPKRSTQIFVLL